MDVGTQDNPAADPPKRAKRTRRVGRRRLILSAICLVLCTISVGAQTVSQQEEFGYEGRRALFVGGEGGATVVFRTSGNFGERGWHRSSTRAFVGSSGWIGVYGSRGYFQHDWGVVQIAEPSAQAGDHWAVRVSLWFLIAIFYLIGAVLFVSATRSRSAAIGLCPACRYDLRGLPASAPCPECGKVRVARAVGVASGDEGKGGA